MAANGEPKVYRGPMPTEIPPSQLSDLRACLADPTTDCYVVVGTDSGTAWDNAVALEIDLPPLRVFRIQSRANAAEWLTQNPNATAIIFGFGATPADWLSVSQAEEKDVAAERINAAR